MQRICVYCGSSPGRRAVYAETACRLARALVGRGLGLVYGGASVGVMGMLADAVLAAGGEVVGIIPRGLVAKEVGHTGLSDLRVVDSMHERKALMADLADGFIALPGGFGTLEELFEIITWAQLGMHRKPCGLVNTDGYYDGLIAFLRHAAAERFIKDTQLDMLLVEQQPAALLDRFARYRAPAVPKWLDRENI